jgi:hypothetical protein
MQVIIRMDDNSTIKDFRNLKAELDDITTRLSPGDDGTIIITSLDKDSTLGLGQLVDINKRYNVHIYLR